MEIDPEVQDLIAEIKRMESFKRRPGTRIYYAKKRLARLIEVRPMKTERKTLSQRPSPRKRRTSLYTVDNMQKRAYVLSCETYDLTQAMIALERLRRR